MATANMQFAPQSWPPWALSRPLRLANSFRDCSRRGLQMLFANLQRPCRWIWTAVRPRGDLFTLTSRRQKWLPPGDDDAHIEPIPQHAFRLDSSAARVLARNQETALVAVYVVRDSAADCRASGPGAVAAEVHLRPDFPIA